MSATVERMATVALPSKKKLTDDELWMKWSRGA
jgi:hypothetical protein